jgi:hypothetical protein
MSDNVFYNRCWMIAAAVVIVGMCSCTVNSVVKLDTWEKAVANGADPMVVSCALYGQSEAEKISCHTLAQNRK